MGDSGTVIAGALGAGGSEFLEQDDKRRSGGLIADAFDTIGSPEASQFAGMIRQDPATAVTAAEAVGGMQNIFLLFGQRATSARVAESLQGRAGPAAAAAGTAARPAAGQAVAQPAGGSGGFFAGAGQAQNPEGQAPGAAQTAGTLTAGGNQQRLGIMVDVLNAGADQGTAARIASLIDIPDAIGNVTDLGISPQFYEPRSVNDFWQKFLETGQQDYGVLKFRPDIVTSRNLPTGWELRDGKPVPLTEKARQEQTYYQLLDQVRRHPDGWAGFKEENPGAADFITVFSRKLDPNTDAAMMQLLINSVRGEPAAPKRSRGSGGRPQLSDFQ